jgi:PAS domain S-box-containing protein
MDNQDQSIFDSAYDGLIISDQETGLMVKANLAACKMHGYALEQFIGLPLKEIIHPESQKKFDEFLRTFQSDGVSNTRMRHTCLNGSPFYAEWSGAEINYQGRSCLLGIIRDVSHRIREEQELRQRIEIRTHEQETLLTISQTLASTLELQPDLILDQLREIIEFKHGGLFAVENSSLVTLAIRGAPHLEQSLPFQIHLQGPEILADLFPGFKTVRITSIWDETFQSRTLRSLLDDGAAVLLKGMQSWMWVPLAVKNRIFGCIGVAHEKRKHFTSHHADLALSVANQAAIMMANAELYEKAQTLAALEERQRLARNLHDAINQSLFSAGIIAEVLPRLWYQDQDLVHSSLGDLRKLIRGAQAEMRALLAELRPTTIIDSNLDDLLRLLGNALSGRIDIPVVTTAPADIVLPSAVQVAFYRVCQEALNNIAKHAEASKVEIILSKNGPETELSIRDNGQGFDPEQEDPGHYGLRMMQERTEAVGAQLSITSQPGEGTVLKVRWTNPSKKETL